MLVVDPRGIDLELVDEVRLDHREDFVSGHCAETVELVSDMARARLAQRAGALERVVGAAGDVAGHAARGEHDRVREAAAREAPVADDADLAQAEQVRAARDLRRDLVAKLPAARGA